MPSFKIITGIVLRQIPYGEAEKLFIFITPTGKQRAFAKGVKKSTSRNAGHLELFTHANVQLVDGNSDRKIITSAVSKHRFDEFAYDIQKYALAMFACEMVDIIATETEDTAYLELLNILLYLKTKPYNNNIILYILNRLLHIAGGTPQLETCCNCDTDITPNDLFYSYDGGGSVCKNCQRSTNAININLKTLKIIRNTFRHDNAPMPFDVPLADVSDSAQILYNHLTHHIDTKIKTWSMVKDVVLK